MKRYRDTQNKIRETMMEFLDIDFSLQIALSILFPRAIIATCESIKLRESAVKTLFQQISNNRKKLYSRMSLSTR